MSTKLHPIKHDLPGTLWCGPAALSAVTGEPTSRIHDIIKKIRGDNKPVKGVRNSELVKTAFVLGYALEPMFDYLEEWGKLPYCGRPPLSRFKPTLARFVRLNRKELARFPMIVNVTGHYVVVSGRTFLDNNVGAAVPLKKAPRRRCRVKKAFRVVRIFPGPQ
jgi:hypothetical protein